MSSYKSPRAGSLITALAALALLLTAGCASVGPDYHAPEPNMPERWNATSLEAINAGEADEEALAAWWENLNDPVLTGLIHQALANNHDIRTALARVRESRARLGISEADRYPTLEATGSA
ncbi:MAG: TolC family protein, partial [Akkermansiaceae bacterium]|nr:TolC family protein [Akkermansiaceae bacterium]NIS12045.1 TolC family protein [Thermoplasmata archaeon]